LELLQLTNSTEISKVTIDPLRAAIAVQESKLHLTEAELSPIVVTAPIDGIISTVLHRSGESVTAGQPIVSVATLNPVRIVGYLRPPISDEPKPGMEVEVRTRGIPRVIGLAKIVEVGTQLEAVPATLVGPVKLANTELGLPVEISMPEVKIRAGDSEKLETRGGGPEKLKIRAGELVDILMIPKS
jgi:multidrug efflux pump subunit AcrA (membrane-fusion protein)